MWPFCLFLCPCLSLSHSFFSDKTSTHLIFLPPTPSAPCGWASSGINPVETFFCLAGVSLVLAQKVAISYWKVREEFASFCSNWSVLRKNLGDKFMSQLWFPVTLEGMGWGGVHSGNAKFLPTLSGYYGQVMWCLPSWSIKCSLNPVITAKIVKRFLKIIISTSIR